MIYNTQSSAYHGFMTSDIRLWLGVCRLMETQETKHTVAFWKLPGRPYKPGVPSSKPVGEVFVGRAVELGLCRPQACDLLDELKMGTSMADLRKFVLSTEDYGIYHTMFANIV